jgi:hypothetical protein
MGQGVAEEALAKAMESMRKEVEVRMAIFERRLREQFARELAQIVSSRPWMKDVQTQKPDAAQTAEASPIVSELRDQVAILQQRIDAGLRQDQHNSSSSDAADFSQRMTAVKAVQEQLESRLALIEQRLTLGPVPVTRVTDLHVHIDSDTDGHESETIPAQAMGAEENPSQSWLFEDDSHAQLGLTPSLTQTAINNIVAASTSSLTPPSDSHAAHSLPQAALRGKADALETAKPSLTPPQPMGMPATSGLRPGIDEGHIRRLIEERLSQWKAPAGEGLVADDDEILAQFVRILPLALEDNSVRTALFATIALEAIEKPGALAHLSGLRDFLRAEMAQLSSV